MSKAAKIEYVRRVWSRGWVARGSKTQPITRGLPFYQSGRGRYVHRVRSGDMHYDGEEYRHTSLVMWCGMHGFLPSRSTLNPNKIHHEFSRLMAEPPSDSVFCATCEGRAIGSGQCGAPVICGRAVKFSPRI